MQRLPQWMRCSLASGVPVPFLAVPDGQSTRLTDRPETMLGLGADVVGDGEQQMVADVKRRVLVGHEDLAVAVDEGDGRVRRQPEVGDIHPGHPRALGKLELQEAGAHLVERRRLHVEVVRGSFQRDAVRRAAHGSREPAAG